MNPAVPEEIEIVQTKAQVDPDLLPAMGKPIVKLIWDNDKKNWTWVADNTVFPNLEFIASGLHTCLGMMDETIRLNRELQFHQRAAMEMQQRQQAAMFAQSLRPNGR